MGSRRDQGGPEGTKGVQKGSRGSRRDQGGAGVTKGVHEGPKEYKYSPRRSKLCLRGLRRLKGVLGVQESSRGSMKSPRVSKVFYVVN